MKELTTLVKPHMVEALKEHELTSFHTSARVWPDANTQEHLLSAFWMRRPASHRRHAFYTVLVVFAPIGIILGGDIRFGDIRSLVSDAGYGQDWFGGELSEQYLCEKFGLDWSNRPPKSKRTEMMQCACGWLAAVQQKFHELAVRLGEEYHSEVHSA